METAFTREHCLRDRLLRPSTNASDANRLPALTKVTGRNCFPGELQHWFQETVLRFSNRKLRRVDPHCDAPCSSSVIVTRECALSALIEFSLGRECQWMRGNDQSISQRTQDPLGRHRE